MSPADPEIRRYRRRPADGDIVDAMHYTGGFPLEFLKDDEQVRSAGEGAGAMVIETRSGTRKAQVEVGDWILRHHNGGVSAIKPDLFDETYEPTRPER